MEILVVVRRFLRLDVDDKEVTEEKESLRRMMMDWRWMVTDWDDLVCVGV